MKGSLTSHKPFFCRGHAIWSRFWCQRTSLSVSENRLGCLSTASSAPWTRFEIMALNTPIAWFIPALLGKMGPVECLCPNAQSNKRKALFEAHLPEKWLLPGPLQHQVLRAFAHPNCRSSSFRRVISWKGIIMQVGALRKHKWLVELYFVQLKE